MNISTALVDKSRERTNTLASRSSINLNKRSQSRISVVINWSCGKRGHLTLDCLKLENENGKEIRVESANDIAIVANSTLDGFDYVLSIIEDLSFNE